MNMKLVDARNYYVGLLSLSEKAFPGKLGYAIMRNTKRLQDEVELYEKERENICKRNAAKDEKGEPVTKKNVKTQQEEYVFETKEAEKLNAEEVRKLGDTDIEFDVYKVKFEVLEQCYGNERYDIPTVNDLNALEFMLED